MNSIKDMLDAGRAAIAATKKAEAEAEAQREQDREALKDARFAPLAEAVAKMLPPPLYAHSDLGRHHFDSLTTHAVTINIPGMVTFKAWFHLTEWIDRDREIGMWTIQPDAYRIPAYERVRNSDGESIAVVAREHEWARTSDACQAVALAFEEQNKRLKLELECVTENKLAAENRKARAFPRLAEPSLEEKLVAALRAWVLDVVPVPAE